MSKWYLDSLKMRRSRERTHSDINVLGQRVAATETAIRDISMAVGQLRAETTSQINGLSSSLGSQIGDLAKSFNSSRNTNWNSTLQTGAAIFGVFAMVLSPILVNQNAMISRNDTAIEAIKSTRFSRDDALAMRGELTTYIKAVSDRSVTLPEFETAMRDRDKLRDTYREDQKADIARNREDEKTDHRPARQGNRPDSRSGRHARRP